MEELPVVTQPDQPKKRKRLGMGKRAIKTAATLGLAASLATGVGGGTTRAQEGDQTGTGDRTEQVQNPEQEVSIPRDIVGNEAELRGKVIITIDDCPNEELTRHMYETLNERGLKATFLPNSNYIKNHDPQMWRDMVANGFEIGYHTQNHDGNMTVEELNADFDNFQETIRQILDDPDHNITIVRPPYGSWDQNWNTFVEQRDLHNLRWNMVPNRDTGMNYFRAIINRDVAGPIVLFHPRNFDVDFLDNNIDELIDLVGGPEKANAQTFPTVTGAFQDGDLGLDWYLSG